MPSSFVGPLQFPSRRWEADRDGVEDYRAFYVLRQEIEKARAAGEEILIYCIEAGGTITGEHGVGMEKNELMARQFTPDTLETIRRLKQLFDPESRLNPGKLLPTGRGCAEVGRASWPA